ncbi:MAG: thioesterase domain-containing protein [Chromatiaceae bacterium]|nr:thioesterase domain-containing protein [Chromatiaceae bacterium]
MNAAAELQRRIDRSIPLSSAMGYRITALDDTRISVAAPLAPNINVHGTGFAGSLYALGILAAWGLCAHIIARAGLKADLVVAEATIRYRAPVRGEIVCSSAVADAQARDFVDQLATSGRARMVLQVTVGDGPAAAIEASMHATRT